MQCFAVMLHAHMHLHMHILEDEAMMMLNSIMQINMYILEHISHYCACYYGLRILIEIRPEEASLRLLSRILEKSAAGPAGSEIFTDTCPNHHQKSLFT